jgi:RNA polymerase sigma-70 factor (ECF subfamily)
MFVQTYDQRTTSLDDPADGILIKESLAGEQKAFECLVSRYEKPLFNFICHFFADNSEKAGDTLQDVFLKLYVSLPTLHTDQPLKPWLFQVARHRCLDELRRKHSIPFSQLEAPDEEDDTSPVMILPDPDPLPQEMVEYHELQQLLRRAIDELPPKFRQVVLLRYTGQFTFVEIGTILTMPQATAKTYFQRARPLLRRVLSAYRGQDEKVSDGMKQDTHLRG